MIENGSKFCQYHTELDASLVSKMTFSVVLRHIHRKITRDISKATAFFHWCTPKEESTSFRNVVCMKSGLCVFKTEKVLLFTDDVLQVVPLSRNYMVQLNHTDLSMH
jgi:hypothetical protein